ncbi:MAG: imidazole glycerol phosphate synthase subunit HisF [Thermonemataceae bacterium]|nr:imidazole glycerol phosphate synthase subunit HisF [Thermonemataceae bacterium]
MLTKRIIPCLDIKNGRTVKGINFENLVDAGNPVELAQYYAQEGADELVFLDIAATLENRGTLIKLVKDIAAHINIPFTVGGGIRSKEDVSDLLRAGADKISINSAAVKEPSLIDELAKEFGSQCVVVAIDTRSYEAKHKVHTHGGKKPTDLLTVLWAKEAQERGAGEILLTSMEADGTKNGFDIAITALISENLHIPVIASGGAGKMEHFSEVFQEGKADAALAASIFHFKEIAIKSLKQYLNDCRIEIRL